MFDFSTMLINGIPARRRPQAAMRHPGDMSRQDIFSIGGYYVRLFHYAY